MAYLALKVSILLLLEAGIFPLFCGWWLDICSFVSNTLLFMYIYYYLLFLFLVIIGD